MELMLASQTMYWFAMVKKEWVEEKPPVRNAGDQVNGQKRQA